MQLPDLHRTASSLHTLASPPLPNRTYLNSAVRIRTQIGMTKVFAPSVEVTTDPASFSCAEVPVLTRHLHLGDRRATLYKRWQNTWGHMNYLPRSRPGMHKAKEEIPMVLGSVKIFRCSTMCPLSWQGQDHLFLSSWH